MPEKSIDRYSTHSAARVSLALLLTVLLVFPDGVAWAQSTCPAPTSPWTLSGVPLPTANETFGAAVASTTGGNFIYVIGGEKWSGSTPTFSTNVYHKLAGSVASQTSGTWFSNPLWKDPNPPMATVGLARDLCGVAYTNSATSTSYLYTVGGVYYDSNTTSTGNSTNMVWYNQIQSNGNLSTTWNQANSIPSGANGLQLHGTAIVTVPGTTNTYLYVIGGSTADHGDGTVNQNVTPAVHFAKINSDGSLAAWDHDGNGNPATLPPIPTRSGGNGVYKTCPVVHNGTIYVSGGEDQGQSLDQVVYATPISDGTFSNGNTWTNQTSNYIDINNTLTPDAAQAVVYNKGIILMGGDEGGTIHVVPTVYQGVVGTGGGVTWNDTAIGALPISTSRNAGATSGTWIFSLGGLQSSPTGSADVNCVYYATAP